MLLEKKIKCLVTIQGKHKNNSNRPCNFQTRTGKNRNKTINLIEAEKKVFFNRKNSEEKFNKKRSSNMLLIRNISFKMKRENIYTKTHT